MARPMCLCPVPSPMCLCPVPSPMCLCPVPSPMCQSLISRQLPDPGGGTLCPARTVWSVLRPLLEGGVLSGMDLPIMVDSPALWAAVPGLASAGALSNQRLTPAISQTSEAD
ncbi:unnamed protein product, partial [Staurois parvus]